MQERVAIRERFTLRRSPAVLEPSFAEDVRHGLTSRPKRLPPRYFYDSLGSALFEAICELPEYYVTRAETEIFQRSAHEIARTFEAPARLVELGSGDSRKTEMLIEALLGRQPSLTFVPIDVDASMLDWSARRLLATFPALTVEAICGDYRQAPALVTPINGRTVVLFLGSSIGNLDPQSAAAMLGDLRAFLHPGDLFFLGADLQKEKTIVEPAYNDSLGVTASFNRNMLARINRQLGGHFDLSSFDHYAFLNERESRIEMHLVSRLRQSIRIDALELEIEMDEGETIHTENSYKYSTADLQTLAAAGGFAIEAQWTDSRQWFADVLMSVC
jgi:L-histidine N-alpha-methyltransferase